MKLFKTFRLIICIFTIFTLFGCVGNDSSTNSQLQNPITPSTQSAHTKATTQLPIDIAWTLDGEGQQSIMSGNYKDMGWHVLTMTVASTMGESVVAPVQGIKYEIMDYTPAGLRVDVNDINCESAVFTKVGDSCSAYIRLSYGESASGVYLARVNFYPGSFPLIPDQINATDQIMTQYSVSDYRAILPIETQYYQGSAIKASPGKFEMASIENGNILPVNITSLPNPSNSKFTVVHRTTGGANDPYYGSFNECAVGNNANSSLNQVSKLVNLNESCIVVYQASESAEASQESATVSLKTDSDMWFPYSAGNFNLLANYSNGNKNTSINWTFDSVPVLPVANQGYRSIAYGNNEFVAANVNGVVAISKDGLNWATTWYNWGNFGSIAYGNGFFLMIGAIYGGGAGYVSTDGINWQAVSLPAHQYWVYATYGGGKFVVVSSGQAPGGTNEADAAVSTDGVHWTQATMPPSKGWEGVTYGNGKYVAVSNADMNGTNIAAVSTDAIHWQPSTLPLIQHWVGVAYGSGKFVAISNSQYAAISSDGINWKSLTLPISGPLAITYGNGLFMAVGLNGDAAISADGLSWESVPISSGGNFFYQAVTSGNNQFIACGNSYDTFAVGSIVPVSLGTLNNFTISSN